MRVCGSGGDACGWTQSTRDGTGAAEAVARDYDPSSAADRSSAAVVVAAGADLHCDNAADNAWPRPSTLTASHSACPPRCAFASCTRLVPQRTTAQASQWPPQCPRRAVTTATEYCNLARPVPRDSA